MKILIAEDEQVAIKYLVELLDELLIPTEMIDVVQSVAELKEYLQVNTAPDLMLLDIQLQDGKSIDVFDEMPIATPVIFITAFDDYVIDSFKANSIQYLLKPIQKDQLEAALNKFYQLVDYFKMSSADVSKSKKERIIVRKGSSRISVPLKNIAFFYSEMKLNFAVSFLDERFYTDQNLTQLESIVTPENFFRITRKLLVHINAIKEFKSIEFSKVEINLMKNSWIKEPIVVSQFTAPDFKKWVESL
jgi:DNA-binding LytR/AlgR family response regulator